MKGILFGGSGGGGVQLGRWFVGLSRKVSGGCSGGGGGGR